MPKAEPIIPNARRRPTRRAGCRQIVQPALVATTIAMLSAGAANSDSGGQASPPIDARRPVPAMNGRPLAQPLVKADVHIEGRRVQSWRGDQPGEQYLLVDGDVRLKVGLYHLRASRMVVRIRPDSPGTPASGIQIAAYLQDARSTDQPATETAIDSEKLLVTARVNGKVSLGADGLDYQAATAHPLNLEAAERFAEFDALLSRPTRTVPEVELFGPEAEQLRRQRRAEIQRDLLQAIPTQPPEVPPEAPPEVPAEIPPEAPAEPTPAFPAQPPREVTPEQPPELTHPHGPPATPQPPSDADAGDSPEVRPVVPMPERNILPRDGLVSFAARRVVIDAREGTAALIGEVRMVYHGAAAGGGRTLQADRAVIFFDQDAGPAGQSLQAASVRGVYLEDNVVVTDGEFTARAPRMFYDPSRNQALLLDAVIFAPMREVAGDGTRPLYLRASRIQQESQQRFEARDATLTTTDFARPHLALGASRLTLERSVDEDGQTQDRLAATHVRLEAGGLPFFYLPRVAGDVQRYPIRRVGVDINSRRGTVVTTTWDGFAVVGNAPPPGVDSEFSLDYQGNHNIGLGAWIGYDRPNLAGRLEGYVLPWDTGRDRIFSREPIEFDGKVRGMTRWVHQQYFEEENLLLEGELAYVSDPSFLEEFRPAQAENDAPWQNRIRIKQQGEDAAATVQLGWQFLNFAPQTYAMQWPGYVVDKHAELGYYTIGLSFWEDRMTYYGQTRVSYLRIAPATDTPADRGFAQSDSQFVFGIDADRRFGDELLSGGYPDDRRLRFDSRHEFRMPLNVDNWRLTPYLVGQVTAYDNDFEAFRGMGDPYRAYGVAGVSLTTEYHAGRADVAMSLLDVRGLRHIIQPFTDISYAAGTSSAGKLPVFDREIEGVEDGLTVRGGIRQILQTQRGGMGQWQTVDWITLHTEAVFRQNEIDSEAPLPRFFEHRPELTSGGSHARGELTWMFTDSLALRAEALYSFEHDRLEEWRVGGVFNTEGRIRAFVSYAEIEAFDEQRLSWGTRYRFTEVYALSLRQSYDFGPTGSRSYGIELARAMPQWTFLVTGQYNETSGDFSLGFSLEPNFGF